MMHDGMRYDPIQGQGQGQGHVCLKATRGVNRQSRTELTIIAIYNCLIMHHEVALYFAMP